jgi:hypothetical protein
MNTFYVLFAAAMIAAAKSPEMKAPFNNNLPSQTKGVMVNPENPENPDSKPSCCAHQIPASPDPRGVTCLLPFYCLDPNS